MARELLMMQNSFQWGTAEGQTLEIENAIRSNIRDLKIEGQTYQNLLSEIKTLGNYTYDESTGEYTLTNPATGVWNEMFIAYTRPIQAGEKLLIRINIVKNTIKSTQSPAIKITYSHRSNNTKGFITVNNDFTGLLEYYCDGATVNETDNEKIGITTKNYTSGELVIKDIQVIPVSSNPLGSTELPTSINGIESVAEKESNVLQIAQSNCETDGIVLPNGVQNTIEMVDGVLNHIQRVGKYTANDTRFITTLEVTRETSVMFKIYAKSDYSWLKSKNYNNTKSHPICSLFNYIPSEKPVDELYVSESDDACFYTGGADWVRVKLTKATYGKIISLTEFLEMKPIIYYELITPVYTPIEEVTNIDLPVPLRSLPKNNVRDTIENGKLIQRVGVFNASKNYSSAKWMGSMSPFLEFDFMHGSNRQNDNVYCNTLPYKTMGYNSEHNEKGFSTQVGFRIKPFEEDNKTREEYETWLKENETIIYYELVNPIVHELNIPPISIAKGGNIITTANNITPNLSMKYKKSKK